MVIGSEKVRWLLALSAGAILVFLAVNALYALGLISVMRFLWGASVSALLIGCLALCREEDSRDQDPEPAPRTASLL